MHCPYNQKNTQLSAVLHSMDDTIKMALFSQHVGPDFNNQDAYTDAQVMSSDGVLIHVHKHIVAKACPYLAIASSPTWNAGNEPVKLDASHATATLFLKYFYTGELCWPEGPDAPSRHQCALELLQLADKYNVPVLLCAAEVVLSQAVDENTCCELLDIADTYHAEQLKGLCLHRVKKAYGIVRDTEEFRALSAHSGNSWNRTSESSLPCELSTLQNCLCAEPGAAA